MPAPSKTAVPHPRQDGEQDMPNLRDMRRKFDILFGNGSEAIRFYLVARLVRILLPNYRLRWYQLDWWRDADFNAFLEHFGETHSFNIDRKWMIHQLLRLISDVPGDTAECGAYLGATSFLICRANEQATRFKRMHFIFDSFEGLSEPHRHDGGYWRKGDLTAKESVVRERLRRCKDFVLMKGWIPSRFGELADRRFAFVHIDVDLYEPTRDSIEFFYPRLNEGGILVIDDFGFSTCPGATRAAAEASEDLPERFIALPDGGGVLIKGRSTVPAANLMPAP
jgi:hypothetical protein